ncbi:MAG: TetR/AcrR family transcriptional regulator [Salinivirgaceae bacterium]|nr:TetR/AcrR family transcriptional regulator [Salinivirgaceae bacterium]
MQTERQAQIINISMEIIANKGIQGFTIKNISKEIGISEPAIYRHFENKTAILITILDNFKAMIGSSSSSLMDSENTAIGKIECMFSRMLTIFIEQPAIISVIFSEEIFKSEIVLKNKILEIQNLNQARIENIIEKGQADNNVRTDIDKSTFALMFMGAFRLLVKRWDLNDYNSNLKLEGGKLLNSFKLFI